MLCKVRQSQLSMFEESCRKQVNGVSVCSTNHTILVLNNVQAKVPRRFAVKTSSEKKSTNDCYAEL